MSTRYSFDTRYKVRIPERKDWKTPELQPKNGDIRYTDGSKVGRRLGAGIYGKTDGIEIAVSLGEYATVFQSEVYAIREAARRMLTDGKTGRQIRICSDSSAALLALKSPAIDSRVVWGCREALNSLSENNGVELLWVPGHTGIRGNEKADELARRGSATGLDGPTLKMGVPFCLGKMAVRRWVESQHLIYWRDTAGCRQSKALMGLEIQSKRAVELVGMDRGRLRAAVHMLSGHCHLNYHRWKLGLTPDPICGLCGEEVETSEHILGRCPALAGLRYQLLGSAVLTPIEIASLPVGQVLGLWRGSRRGLDM